MTICCRFRRSIYDSPVSRSIEVALYVVGGVLLAVGIALVAWDAHKSRVSFHNLMNSLQVNYDTDTDEIAKLKSDIEQARAGPHGELVAQLVHLHGRPQYIGNSLYRRVASLYDYANENRPSQLYLVGPALSAVGTVLTVVASVSSLY